MTRGRPVAGHLHVNGLPTISPNPISKSRLEVDVTFDAGEAEFRAAHSNCVHLWELQDLRCYQYLHRSRAGRRITDYGDSLQDAAAPLRTSRGPAEGSTGV